MSLGRAVPPFIIADETILAPGGVLLDDYLLI
jgi:hypothetical protein